MVCIVHLPITSFHTRGNVNNTEIIPLTQAKALLRLFQPRHILAVTLMSSGVSEAFAHTTFTYLYVTLFKKLCGNATLLLLISQIIKDANSSHHDMVLRPLNDE